MIYSATNIISAIALLVIFLKGESIINRMSEKCWLPLRLAFFSVAVGAVMMLSELTKGLALPPGIAFILSGIAGFMMFDASVYSIFIRPRKKSGEKHAAN